MINPEYLVLVIELDQKGIVFACLEETGAKTPSSKQIWKGLNSKNQPCKASNSTFIDYDTSHNLPAARTYLTKLQPSTTYDVFYISALNIPNDVKLSPIVNKVTGTTEASTTK